MTTNEQLKKDINEFFEYHSWNTNEEVIDQILIAIENEFCRRYNYNWNDIDTDYLIEKAHEEV